MYQQQRLLPLLFFFSRRSRHTRFSRDWSSDVCSSDLGSTLRTTGRTLTAGKPVALSVRQHEIAIAAEKPQSATDNHLNAVVTRQVFLGSARDYTVALDDKTELRVTAPPGRNIAPGE